MAITTLAQVRAGLQPPQYMAKTPNAVGNIGQWLTLWDRPGYPQAALWDTTLPGVALTAPVFGQLGFLNPPSGNAYLARFTAVAQRLNVLGTGSVMLVDRLWHNGGFTITSTSPQTVNSVAFPPRDENGSSNGVGVLLALMVNTTPTAGGPPTVAVSYTNSNGVAGRTAVNIHPAIAVSNPDHVMPLSLDAGDVGVQSVQSLTFTSAWSAGVVALVAYRPILFMPVDLAARTLAVDAISGAMPRILNDSVLELWATQGVNTMISVEAEATYAFG
jgi:hypothetical protein